MLQIHNLSKSYATQTLFDNAGLQMTAGERLGLIGRNGSGKTTLFKIILGLEEPDSGQVVCPNHYRIGYLRQHLSFTQPTLLAEACLGLSEAEQDQEYKVETILCGLGFTDQDWQRPPEHFSGGFQIRLNLAKVLVSNPNLLLLDEPTNYLDIVSLEWFRRFLKSFEGEAIIISHDRDFLDGVTTHTAVIHRLKIKKIPGPTKKLYDQILAEEEVYENTRINDEKLRKKMEVFITRFRAKATKASVVQSRVKMLERLPLMERLSDWETLDFEFRHAPFAAKTLMETTGLSFGFDKGPTLISNLNLKIGAQDRIAVIGKNGKGKSTLLALLAGELAPVAGEIKQHANTRLGYFGQTNILRLTPACTIEEEIYSANPLLSRTTVRNLCGTMMFDGDKSEKKIAILSGGEKSRVLLGKILAHPSNLLLLDEPTNHLDMESIQALMDSIEDYPGAVVLVTHSEMILRQFATRLVVFRSGAVAVFEGSYDEFLEKVGWDEDGPALTETDEQKRQQKEDRVQSREKKALHDKQSNRIKKEMDALEHKIIQLENTLHEQHHALAQASQDKDVEKIREFSLSLPRLQTEIDVLFDKLSDLNEQYLVLRPHPSQS